MLLAGLVLALAADLPGAPLTPWVPGALDIHQIATGRGNSAFLQLPDGSTLLIDAGAAGELKYADPKPDASRRPGQWIAAYIDRVLPKDAPRRIDTALVTHLHVDHMGGLADVNAALPIRRLIDRAWPAYNYPEPVPDALMKTHRPIVDAIRAQGGTVEQARAGSKDQISLANPGSVSTPLEVRIVAVNGEVWTGEGDGTRPQFPPQSATTRVEDRPSENECSVALRLTFGAFTFYTGAISPAFPIRARRRGATSRPPLDTPSARLTSA